MLLRPIVRERRVCALALFVAVLLSSFALLSNGNEAFAAGERSPIPSASTQLILGVAPDWNSSQVQVQRFTRSSATEPWSAVADAAPGRLGKNGLVWGRGLHRRTASLSDKAEGDGRTPAGAFKLGRAFGYSAAWASKTKLPYVTVGTRDLLVEDPASKLYNKYVRLDHEPETPFEIKQQMRQNDPQHRLKIFIEHNTKPSPVAGKGSAILFHIWRNGGDSPTTGCTALSDEVIESFMSWLDPAATPVYVILPQSEFEKRKQAWGLPVLT